MSCTTKVRTNSSTRAMSARPTWKRAITVLCATTLTCAFSAMAKWVTSIKWRSSDCWMTPVHLVITIRLILRKPGNYLFRLDHFNSLQVIEIFNFDNVLQRCIQSLVHACQCRDANCRLASCKKMSRVVNHTRSCKRKTNGGCPICKQLIALCCYHAKNCPENKVTLLFILQFRRNK